MKHIHSHERQIVAFLLLIAVGLGVLRALVTPMWSNPEEPTHFERIRLTAEQRRIAVTPDPGLKAEIQATFVLGHSRIGVSGWAANARILEAYNIEGAEDWAALRTQLAEDASYYEEIFLGAPQYDEPFLYYVYQALLQTPVNNTPIQTQLMTARLGSVVLAVVAVGLTYLAARELFPTDPLLRIAIPAVMVALPNFITEMSAVNNTAAAVVAYIFLLWAAIRVVRQGLSLSGVALLIVGLLLCLLSKPTAWGGLLVFVLAVPFALKSKLADRVLIGAAAAGALLTLALFTLQGPLGWYPVSTGASQVTDAADGRRAFVLRPEQLIWQHISPADVSAIQGETVTLGAWMRTGAADAVVALPSVWYALPDDRLQRLQYDEGAAVEVDGEWAFHTTQLDIPPGTRCLSLRVAAVGSVDSPVEYDGITLTHSTAPDDNLLANGSAEARWLLLRPEIERQLPDRLADTGLDVNARLATYLDLHTNLPLISQTVRFLFSTFWSRFAWTMPGLPVGVIAALGALSAVSLAGLGKLVITRWAGWEAWQRRALIIMVAAAFGVILLSLLRLDPPPQQFNCHRYQGRFIAASYYTSPGFFPLLGLWVIGLMAWVPDDHTKLRRWIVVGLFLGFFVINLLSLLNRQIPFIVLFYGLEYDPGIWSVPRSWGP